MESRKNEYRRWGWFLIAATVVALILANTVDASLPVLILIGVIGFGWGAAMIAVAELRIKQ